MKNNNLSEELSAVAKAKCNICGHRSTFINKDRGKEGWQCSNCSASSRNRLVMLVLGKLIGHGNQPAYAWPVDKTIKILEPCPRGPQSPILRDKFDYHEPEFDQQKIEDGADPRQYATVEALAFPDDTFDYVIASDVFEHVRYDQRGFQEIYRTLKPDGTFIFTSPYDHQREKTFVRVAVEGDEDIPLTDRRYAGGGGVTLDYREYGRDVHDQLREIGYSVAFFRAEVSQHKIHPSAIMACQKSPFCDMSNFLAGFGDNPQNYSSLGYLLPNRLFVFYKWNIRNALQYLREAKRAFFG